MTISHSMMLNLICDLFWICDFFYFFGNYITQRDFVSLSFFVLFFNLRQKQASVLFTNQSIPYGQNQVTPEVFFFLVFFFFFTISL